MQEGIQKVRQGHFHFHAGSVSRAKGYSSVKVAAYQSGQKLTHEQQLVSHRALRIEGQDVAFNAPYISRHELRRGVISEDLRNAFAEQGITLSEAATGKTKKRGGFEIVDGDRVYAAKRHNVVDTLPLEHRKRMNKGVITDELRDDLAGLNIQLSRQASVTKDSRRQWTITDKNAVYTIREHEKKERTLHVYADTQHNFKKRGDVKETALLVPAWSESWLRDIEARGKDIAIADRQKAWNRVEALDKDVDSKTAHRMNLSLSRYLSYDENKAILHAFAREQFTDKGLLADIAIHDKPASDSEPNLHAHILISTREIQKNGQFAKKKSGYWDKPERIEEWRQAWAKKQNTALADNGSDVRVDPRSYERQGLDILPGEHMGADWYADPRHETEIAQNNAAIERINRIRDRWLAETARRMPAARYTEADQQAYEAKQQGQENQLYEPDAATRQAQVEAIKTAEHRQHHETRIRQQEIQALADAEKATSVTQTTWYGSRITRMDMTQIRPIWRNPYRNKDPSRLPYAFKETRTRFFGWGARTTRIMRPGLANVSRKQREALEAAYQQSDRLDTEAQQGLEAAREYHFRSIGRFLGDPSSGSSSEEVRKRLHRLQTVTREKFQEIRERWQDRVKPSNPSPEPER